MAKAVATIDEKSKAMAAVEAGLTMPSSSDLEAGTGQGISREAADNLIPIITVFQSLSPQVNKQDPRYIEGAEAGKIWLRNTPDAAIIDGDTGFYWQWVAYQRRWIEWIDRDAGGGFVAAYDDAGGKPALPGVVKSAKNPWNWVNPATGNEIALFHNHLGYVLGHGAPQPYLISYKGSGLRESRNWMSMVPLIREDTQAKSNLFDYIWLVAAKYKSNTKGHWHDLVPVKRLPGFAKPEQIKMGRELADSFASNKVQADMRGATGAGAPAAETGEEIPF